MGTLAIFCECPPRESFCLHSNDGDLQEYSAAKTRISQADLRCTFSRAPLNHLLAATSRKRFDQAQEVRRYYGS